MNAVRITPFPEATLRRFRDAGIDDLGQPVERLVAEGGEPLRDLLRRARPGERLILASFSPFDQPGPYREFGAVFVLAEASDEIIDATRLSGGDGSPEAYFQERLVLRAYSREQRIVDARLLTVDELDDGVDALFARTDAAYLHARFPTYGCFACRIERAA